jgi:hypothetical protein
VSFSGVDKPDQIDSPAQTDEARYDVFLAYNTDDRMVVQKVARQLRESGIRVWLDTESLTPGGDWQQEVSAGVLNSRAYAVFIGPHGARDWGAPETDLVVDRVTRDHNFRIFAVLLPGIEAFDAASLPPFLATKQWIDLREGPSPMAMQGLINAIQGSKTLTPVSEGDVGERPYRGLEPFGEEDSRYFFGRTAQVQRLVEDLRRSRFLAVIGQSGIGKSSLVRAGLLPQLRAGALPNSASWQIVTIRPGAHPLAALASRLVSLHGAGIQDKVDQLVADERTLALSAALAVADEPAGSKLFLLVDQFEEMFTLCTDASERSAFVRNILYATTVPHGSTVVVITMRADFYPQIAEFPEFAQLVQSHHMLVPRLGHDELRAIITEPAYAAGLTIEQGLTDTILADVGRRPGNLPLLEHALLETWLHRHGNMLTLAGYRATGGIEHGLGESAEAVYMSLSDEGRVEAKNLFLRLVQPGEGTEDTRRRVPVTEFGAWAGSAVSEVIEQFVAARLLTVTTDDATGEHWVEIAHEAVITGWERCARWIDEDRAGILIHRRLTRAAQEWKRLGQSSDALYRGVVLAEALAWRDRAIGRLNWLENDFLDASSALDRSRLRWLRRPRYINAQDRRRFESMSSARGTARSHDTDAAVPSIDGGSPNRLSLSTTGGAAILSIAGGLAGAAFYDDPILDWIWLAWSVLGLLAGILTIHSTLKRRKYISSLLIAGLKTLTSDDPIRVDSIISELLAIGATHEVRLLALQLILLNARR